MSRTAQRSRSRFAHAMTAAASLTVASCVPASEAAPPAGAFGFVTEPSSASRGEPFGTTDGWTVRIEKLALRVSVGAYPLKEAARSYAYGGSETYLFDASNVVEVFSPGIPVGRATGNMTLSGAYLEAEYNNLDERTEVIGLSPEVSARFRVPAEATLSGAPGGSYASYNGPSVLLAVRAEKSGRVVVFDLTLAMYSGSGYEDGKATREVRADALVRATMAVRVEALFVDEKTNTLQFDVFAAADADRDGVVTGPELSAGPFQSIAGRGRGLFVAR